MFQRLGAIARKAQEAQAAISAMENKDGPKANGNKVNGDSRKDHVGAEHNDLADHDIDDLLDFIEVKLESLYLQDKEEQQHTKNTDLETKLQSLNLQDKEKQHNASQLKLENTNLKTEDSVVPKKNKNNKKKKNKKKVDACKGKEEGAQETKNEGDNLKVEKESTIVEIKAKGPEAKEDAQKIKTNVASKSQDDDGGGGVLLAKTEERSASRTKAEKKAEDEANFFKQWDEYFGKRELADWQRLCRDLGLPDDLPSKTQCCKAISKVHVNIRQFLSVTDRPAEVKVFKSVHQLAYYTRKNGLWMPKKDFPKGDPLGKLRREINGCLY